TLLVFDIGLLGLITLIHWRPTSQGRPEAAQKPAASASRTTLPGPQIDRHWLLIGILSLALTGGFLRFTNLDYAEFQGDEARVTLYSANVIQGYENALFIHRKGPAEILLPTVLYALTEQLTETTARLPFTLANFAALFALFLLGWRLFGPVAGWTAAMLLAVDGYFVGFARIVQYQSIVFLMAVLVVLIGYRLVRQPQALSRYFTLAALFLATGLLSHYEAILVLVPATYLLWRIWRQGTPLGYLARALITPIIFSGLLLASFYLPFVLKPDFAETFGYLVGYRLGAGGTYNNLVDFFNRTTLYSSTYYVLTLIGLAIIGLLLHFARNLSGRWRWLAIAIVLGGMALTFWSPNWLTLGQVDDTWFFFAALLVAAWLMPNFPAEERLVWLWFGAPMLFNLFFTAIPNTHVYGFFMAWALLAGLVVARGWAAITQRWSLRTAQLMAAPIALGAILVFGLYEYWYFVYHDVEVLRTWSINRPHGYWVTYDQPTDVAIFGFPLNTGWKAVASLYAAGVLQGNYATNVTDTVANWYTRGANDCARDAPTYYILANRVEPGRAENTEQLRRQLQIDHELFGTVLVNGQPGLEIYQKGKTGRPAQQFPLEPYAAHFDRTLSGANLLPNGPIGDPAIQHPLNLRLGDAIWLKGYDLDQEAVKPGETLPLTLYWQATKSITKDYLVFVQLIDLKDGRKAGQRDGQPNCEANPTTFWLPGDMLADRYTVPVEPNASAGEYTLLVGMYTGDERLPVRTADGHAQGNQIELTKVQVDS
ncbi:MAG: glycosyltransferase family 39 protein, partial [Chloroflexi bacterium]|nr:glycosyltransferase family 39 protein [Chloroflexota bacterium]